MRTREPGVLRAALLVAGVCLALAGDAGADTVTVEAKGKSIKVRVCNTPESPKEKGNIFDVHLQLVRVPGKQVRFLPKGAGLPRLWKSTFHKRAPRQVDLVTEMNPIVAPRKGCLDFNLAVSPPENVMGVKWRTTGQKHQDLDASQALLPEHDVKPDSERGKKSTSTKVQWKGKPIPERTPPGGKGKKKGK